VVPGTLTLVAGNVDGHGYLDGTLATARFYGVYDLAFDNAGNAYIAEADLHTIRKISASGIVTTLGGKAGHAGSADGLRSAARFHRPRGIAVDAAGNVFVADSGNRALRKISPGGVVSTLAGNPLARPETGPADGTGSAALFGSVLDVTVDTNGVIYVAEDATIRKITQSGVVTTLTGIKRPECIHLRQGASQCNYVDGPASVATLHTESLVADANGNVYFTGPNSVRKVTPDGVVSTLAGQSSTAGNVDGAGSAARFSSLRAITLDGNGDLFVTDQHALVRKISAAGLVTTVAGTLPALSSYADGPGKSASFNRPEGITADGKGNLFVADHDNHVIRKIATDGVVTTYAGTVAKPGALDATGPNARFAHPAGIAVDTAGVVYIAQYNHRTVRKVSPGGVVTTLAGVAGEIGYADGNGSAARFRWLGAIAVDKTGNVYVGDSGTLRKISPSGMVSTLAGDPDWDNGRPLVDGAGSKARFGPISGLTVDNQGNIFVTGRSAIRKVTPDGVVTTVAGSLEEYGHADGAGAAARFYFIRGIVIDAAGNLFVGDTFMNSVIRKITPAGLVTTFAGRLGEAGTTDGTAAASRFTFVTGMTIDTTGKIYLSESTYTPLSEGGSANLIRSITTAGVVTTVAGQVGFTGVLLGSPPANFAIIEDLAFAAPGVLYVTSSNALLKLTLAP